MRTYRSCFVFDRKSVWSPDLEKMMNNYIADIVGSVKMDGPLNDGPKARWQKSSKENSQCNTSSSLLGLSLNASQMGSPKRSMSFSKSPSRNGSKTPKCHTPGKQENNDLTGALSSNSVHSRKTPGKTPGKTPKSSPSDQQVQQDKQRIMSENLHGGDVQNFKVLEYKKKAPAAPEGHVNSMRMVYTSSRTPRSAKVSTRVIPSCPEKILDAPDIMDDYYLNLLDWGKNNILGVALRNAVYLWNESTGNIQQLMEIQDSENYVSSVAWIQEGNILAIGDTTGTVQLWDCNELKQVRTMRSHSGRVGAISWNSYICSSGSRSGAIHHADVRAANFLVAEANAHTQEVCGLKWCPNGMYLASGSNDNLLNIWAKAPSDMHSQSTPLHTFSDHQAAVKALAWCPWQHGVLASGGGTADRHIRFWNVRLGTSMHSVDTKSQASLFHCLVTELVGHTQRVLNLCLSPDGTTVMSAGADETIRLWKVFPMDGAAKRKTAAATSKTSYTSLHSGIR
ncbi:hypothetical protein B566_EDAN016551 [Ephemera danica]|nr:hypothetical protein B566_EDAN016551 [Ephemera danica]